MKKKTVLYKRNARSEPIMWSAEVIDNKDIRLEYGIVGKTLHRDTYTPKRDVLKEYQSIVKAKIKEGGKELAEVYDNSPSHLAGKDLINYLNTYLPKNNTTSDGFVLPMLAKILDREKDDGIGLGQWKINGLRCNISARTIGVGLFEQDSLDFRSREGNQLICPALEQYLMSKIPKNFYKLMKEEGYVLDGELYIPGVDLNEINSAAKNLKNPLNQRLQFWCYDLAIENTLQADRLEILYKNFASLRIPSVTKSEMLRSIHINNRERFVVLPTYETKGVPDCSFYCNMFVLAGFEGLILRNPDREYQFGRRNSAMFKVKPLFDGRFRIINIVPEGYKRSNLAKFILKNDINDEEFECIPVGDFNTKAEYLTNKDQYIGRLAFVEYRTRGGVKDVPMHGNVIKVL